MTTAIVLTDITHPFLLPQRQRSHAMTTISSMHQVTIPCFASANSQSTSGPGAHNVQTMMWGSSDGAGDALDFDLLAEYLLDDEAAVNGLAGGMPTFDFR